MSASGELFISEEVRDTYEKELDDVFGVGKWHLDSSQYRDLWDERDFPSSLKIKVVDDETYEKQIGEITVKVDKTLEDESYIEVLVGDLVSVKKDGKEQLPPMKKYTANVDIAISARSREEVCTKVAFLINGKHWIGDIRENKKGENK
jgi:hypothetical protein